MGVIVPAESAAQEKGLAPGDPGDQLTEIRWHARGGQGAVTAAKMVAELALGQGKYFQAFPEYGPERSGAPIVAFTRVSDEPILLYCGVEHPGIVVVLDASLLGAIDVTKGAPDDAVVLVNSEASPAELRKGHGLKRGRLFTIAATRIANETIKRPIPNTPMVGALTRITGLFPIEKVVEFLRYDFGKKFPPKVVEGNISAIMRAYEEVQSE
jgi:pyruvate ferredoxin oxidoreductase gamma subunit